MPAFTQIPTLGHPRVHRDLAFLLATVVGCCVPFLGQPFHMDDNFYLDMARNAHAQPLFPNDIPYTFAGRFLADMGSHSHPPLQTYVLAAMQSAFGEGAGVEKAYHSCALIFPVLAVFSFYFLAARFVERPLWPSLLLAVAPVFQVMAHTLMTDVPALAFWLGATALFVWAVDLRKAMLFAASALVLFGAMFTSYQCAALVPLLAYYQVRGRGPRAGWIALAAPLIGMAAWLAGNYAHYGRLILVDTLGYVMSRDAAGLKVLGTKVAALLEYQGWLIVFPLFVLCALARGLQGRGLALGTIVAVYLGQMAVPSYRPIDKAIFVIGLVSGGYVLYRMTLFLTQAFGDDDEPGGFDKGSAQFLALWYFGVASYCILVFTEGSARYILPLVPPFLLYFCRQLEVAEAGEYRRARRPLLSAAMTASGSLVLTLAWSLVLSHADMEFARIYPKAARDVERAAGGLPRYFGGEWGFRYYLRKTGAEQLPADDSKVEGASLLVTPRLALPYQLPAPLSSMSARFETLSYRPDTLIRILDLHTPAAFYSTGWGLIPFSLSQGDLETIDIRQVNFLVAELPWARVQTLDERRPWPGYAEVNGRNELALLLGAGTTIAYPWTLQSPARFEAWCGSLGTEPADPYRGNVEFGVCQRAADGKVLASARVPLGSGQPAVSREWLPIRLDIQPAARQTSTLELYYSGHSPRPAAGAFAGAVIRPVDR